MQTQRALVQETEEDGSSKLSDQSAQRAEDGDSNAIFGDVRKKVRVPLRNRRP